MLDIKPDQLQDILPEIWWFIQSCLQVIRQKKVSPGNPFKQTKLVQFPSDCDVVNFNI